MRYLIGFADAAIAYLLLLSFYSKVLALVAAQRLFSRSAKRVGGDAGVGKRLMTLDSSSLYAVERLDMRSMAEKDLNGYFDLAVTVFFPPTNSEANRKLAHDERNVIFEFAQRRKNGLHRWRLHKTNFASNLIHMFNDLRKEIVDEKINLIRAQDPHLLGLTAYLLSLTTGVPYSLHIITNYDIKDRSTRRLACPPFLFRVVEYAVERFLLERAAFVTSSYVNYKDFALCHGAKPSRTFAIRTGVNPIHFLPPERRRNLRQELSVPAGKKLLFYVGRLEKVKFVGDLVDMARVLSRTRDDFLLLIRGQGTEEARLKKEVEDSGLSELVRFGGPLTQEELVNFYYTADVIVFTHAGMTLVEAGLSGTPIVCYDYEWHSEFIGYEERGYLAHFRDHEELAAKLSRCLDRDECSRSKAEEALKFAQLNFNEEKIDALGREVYDRFYAGKI